jgi:type III secretion protein C
MCKFNRSARCGSKWRNEMRRNHFLLVALAIMSASSLLSASFALAAEPRWPDRSLTIEAQDQPVGDFLRELLRSAGLRAQPSGSLSGRISGHFDDSPERIFADVMKAYDLVPYYDGDVMHVVNAQELQSKSIRARPDEIDRIARKVATRTSNEDGVIKLRGVPAFVQDIEALITAQRTPERQPQPTQARSEAPQALIFRTFQLKYASAADQTYYQNGQEVKIPGVVTLLRAMTGISGSLVAASYSPEEPTGQSRPSVRGQGLRRFDRDTRDRERDARDQRAPRDASGYVSDRDSAVRIEADPNLNTVIVRDYGDSMRMYEDLIAQLDREPQLVEIQVTIIDVDRSKLKDLGFDYRFQDGRTSINAGGGDPGPQNGGLLLNTVLGDAGNFLARINALAKNGSAQVVSRPQVLTLSNLEAVLATDQSFFVRVAGDEEVDLFDVSVGTSLRVVPSVAGEAAAPQIRLRVAIEDGSLSEQTVDDIPIVDRATLNTQAVIHDGQSLLLGGLVRDEMIKDTTKVPVLGDVPGIGRLFRRETEVKASQERLFLISPRIVATGPTPVRAPSSPAIVPPPSIPISNSPIARAATPSAPRTTQHPPQAYLDGF